MNKKIVFMFSGQGSQYHQMGKELYEKHARFKLWMDHCDEIVQSYIGECLLDVIYQKDTSTPFDTILYSNPALLCIEYSLAQTLTETGLKPDCLLGYSLGEITALIISGVLSLEDGIKLSIDIAKLLEKKTPSAQMLAIIESVDIVEKFPELFASCWITGKNFKNNFVVSGLPDDIQNLKKSLTQKEIISQKLPVNYGYHTKLIDPMESEFKVMARGISFSSPILPVVSALKSKKIDEINEEYLWQVLRYPVEFSKTVGAMIEKEDYTFIDVGPSGSMATFIKYLMPPDSGSLYFETINQFGKNLNSFGKMTEEINALYSQSSV